MTSGTTAVEEDEYHREATTIAEAFFDCARYNDGDDAKLLLAHLSATPSLIGARDEQGRTAVHLAAANGHIGILEMLMEFGPSPDVRNHEGNTALHFAALNNQLEAARRLLEWGWHASARNVFGKKPIQLIYGKNYEAMETLLLGHDEEIEGCTRGNVRLVVEGDDPPPPSPEPTATATLAGSSCLHHTPVSQFCEEDLPFEEPSFHAEAKHTLQPKQEDPTRLLGSADVDGIE
ncbi:hypothetical protein MOQ_001280 [Trypanosoma cruzi marinkellei]|uniref:Uncharacterized protein n=1 Tax=Trypanosoma cruzi marinkellei TaxID=85056 RepID=K2NU56_TRYCR|nr:hypothetical protein MOQ_001280 [Trypanosoma cruzi marinkellei]